MTTGLDADQPRLAGAVSTRIGRTTAEIRQAARPTRRIAEIEVLRAIAVLLVLYEHMPINLVFWHSASLSGATSVFRGWIGVDLFFAISGFVIARALLPTLARCADGDAILVEAVRFWLRRGWRLLPSAWLWLAVPLVLSLAFNRSGVFYTPRANFDALVAGMLDVANFRLGALYGVKPIGVAFPYWSLSLEEQFYIVLPVMAVLFRRWIVLPLLGLVMLQFDGVVTPLSMCLRTGAISLGVLLAIWEGSVSYRLMRPQILAGSRRARLAMLWLPLLLMAALGSDAGMIIGFRAGLIALLAVLPVWVASYGDGLLWREGWSRRLLLWVAARSYAIYLVHIPVYLAFHEIWFRSHPDGRDPHGWTAGFYVLAALLTIALLASANDRLMADPLRRRGAGIAARFGASPEAGREARTLSSASAAGVSAGRAAGAPAS